MSAFATKVIGDYLQTDRSSLSPRAVEYQVFARITAALETAMGKPDSLNGNFLDALMNNQRLWSAIGVDVASDENGLPIELRERLYYLSEFMRVQTQRILNEDASAQSIIDINRTVMTGLRAMPPENIKGATVN